MKKNKSAVALGKRGGEARAKALTPERRKAIAKNAAKQRWVQDVAKAMQTRHAEILRVTKKHGVCMSDELAQEWVKNQFENAMRKHNGKPQDIAAMVVLAQRLANEQPDKKLPSEKILRACKL